MDFVRRWIEESAYAASLGIALDELGDGTARLHLPFDAALSNGDGVLHGGCAASLAALGAQAVSRAGLGPESGPWYTASLHVSYLSAAREQGIAAEARLLRRGRALCFAAIGLRGDDGRPLAEAHAVVRGRFGAEPADLAASRGDHGRSDPGEMGPFVARTPFIAGRGIAVEHMRQGTSRLRMPWRDANADTDGGVHEGALLSLLDTAGSMACWALTGPGPYRAGTPALQTRILAPLPREELVAFGRQPQRDGDVFLSDVEIAAGSDGAVLARGTVVYRITPQAG